MGGTLLLADDSITIQKVVELTFAETDHRVATVSSGRELFQRLPEVRPDVILCDVVMPDQNGYEVCQALKSDPATLHLPVILLTGTFEPFDRDRALAAGCDAIITKPFEARELIAVVEDMLARSRSLAPAPGDEFAAPGGFGDDEVPSIDYTTTGFEQMTPPVAVELALSEEGIELTASSFARPTPAVPPELAVPVPEPAAPHFDQDAAPAPAWEAAPADEAGVFEVPPPLAPAVEQDDTHPAGVRAAVEVSGEADEHVFAPEPLAAPAPEWDEAPTAFQVDDEAPAFVQSAVSRPDSAEVGEESSLMGPEVSPAEVMAAPPEFEEGAAAMAAAEATLEVAVAEPGADEFPAAPVMGASLAAAAFAASEAESDASMEPNEGPPVRAPWETGPVTSPVVGVIESVHTEVSNEIIERIVEQVLARIPESVPAMVEPVIGDGEIERVAARVAALLPPQPPAELAEGALASLAGRLVPHLPVPAMVEPVIGDGEIERVAARIAALRPEPVAAPAPVAPAELSDEEVDRIARRALEMVAPRLEQIAWEVIPDLAEMLVRRRIAELEKQAEDEN